MALVLALAFNVAGCGIHIFHKHEVTKTPDTDVTNPGRPLPPSPTPTPRTASTHKTGSPAAKPKPTASKTAGSGTAKPAFPVAKPVPGKPGMVFNPFKSNGSYIDVSGYVSGSKVKDPETQKIFVVP